MTSYENRLRAYRFEGPLWTPFKVIITEQAWLTYPLDDLKQLIRSHPVTFSVYDPDFPDLSIMPSLPWRASGRDYVDSWGAVWRTISDGMTGTVIHHPLESWESWIDYRIPDPDRENGWGPVDWAGLAANVNSAFKAGNEPPATELRHGHTLLTLEYLRGFENLVYDMFDEDPRLSELIEKLEKFNSICLRHILASGSEVVGFPEDLGAQSNSLISPDLFRKFIKPSYRRLMSVPKKLGKVVHMHCDGWILNLADDLIECGVNVLNIQDMIHGIDNIRDHLFGRVALELDIDRQNVTVFGTQMDIEDLIREEIEKLSGPEGGLALLFEVRPPVSLVNVDTICSALEKYSGVLDK